MIKFNLDKLREIAEPIKWKKHTEKEREERRKRLHEYFVKKQSTSAPTMKTVAEFIKELSALDQSKPIWIRYDGCYAIVPTIEVSDGETTDEIKKGDYEINAW